MNEKIKQLTQRVGEPYCMFFEGTDFYKGCFAPVYYLYEDAPRFKLPSDNHNRNFLYGMAKIKAHAQEISEKDLQQGDIIAAEYNGELHVAVYIGKKQIIHVFRGYLLQINKLEMIRKGIKGFFRVII